MSSLWKNGGCASLDVLNYRKDHVLVRNRLTCIPLVDECGAAGRSKITHIGVFMEIEVVNLYDPAYVSLLEGAQFSDELGMPIDRREYCHFYDKCGDIPSPNPQEWCILTESLPLALTMRYILRSQAPIALLDRCVDPRLN
jgi:hypothetical protein